MSKINEWIDETSEQCIGMKKMFEPAITEDLPNGLTKASEIISNGAERFGNFCKTHPKTGAIISAAATGALLGSALDMGLSIFSNPNPESSLAPIAALGLAAITGFFIAPVAWAEKYRKGKCEEVVDETTYAPEAPADCTSMGE